MQYRPELAASWEHSEGEEQAKMPNGMPNGMDFGPYGLSSQDAQQGFDMTNPQMTDAYSQSMPSWIKRLQERLRQGGIASKDAIAAGQSQQPLGPSGQEAMGDPMAQRGQALQQSYNQGRNIGQAAQGIGKLFG